MSQLIQKPRSFDLGFFFIQIIAKKSTPHPTSAIKLHTSASALQIRNCLFFKKMVDLLGNEKNNSYFCARLLSMPEVQIDISQRITTILTARVLISKPMRRGCLRS